LNEQFPSVMLARDLAQFREPQTQDFWRVDQRIDVRRAIDRLPPSLKRVALDLESMNVPEICAGRQKSRSRVYQMLGEIRDSFTGQGLKVEARRRPPRDQSTNVRSKVKKS
jgi:hypothetical protein